MKISSALLVSTLACAAYAAPVEADVQENALEERQYGGGDQYQGYRPGWRCYGWGWRRRCWRCPYGRCGGGGYGGGYGDGDGHHKRDVATTATDEQQKAVDNEAGAAATKEPVETDEMVEEPHDMAAESYRGYGYGPGWGYGGGYGGGWGNRGGWGYGGGWGRGGGWNGGWNGGYGRGGW